MENITESIGFLTVNARTSNGAIPIKNALVNIYKNQEIKNGGAPSTNQNGYLVYSLKTNGLGQTEKVALPTRSALLSQTPGNVHPFESYNVFVSADGYFDSDVINIPVFQGITSVQTVNLIPISEFSSPTNDVPFHDSRFVEIPDTDL